MTQHYDVVVIGSGFGGSVTARAGIVMPTSWRACLAPYQNEKSFAWMVPGWGPGTGGWGLGRDAPLIARGASERAESPVPSPDVPIDVIQTFR